MSAKVELPFDEISRRLKQQNLPDVDRVVGVATGGIMPAALVAHQLGKPLSILAINYRDEANRPRHNQPVLLDDAPVLEKNQRILLVDDVSVSGATLEVAKAMLADHQVSTLVLKGKADFVMFPEIAACVNWPWKMGTNSTVAIS